MTPSSGQPNRLRRIVLYICIGFWLAAFVATHVPASTISGVHVSDKTLHLAGYFLLGGVFLITLIIYGVSRTARDIMVLLILAVYGAFDELTQPIVGRTAALGDWFADIGGAMLAIAIVELIPGQKLNKSDYTI